MEQYTFGPAGAQIPDATGATAQSGGARGLVPAPSSGDQDKFLKGDGTWGSVPSPAGKVDISQGSANAGKILRVGTDGDLALDGAMVILSYGSSTWNDFITAYNSKSVVYCRASSNSDPSSGSQTRLAFMAYVNNATSPTEVEFQYYRSVSSHSASQQGDQVFVYKLTSSGSWTVTTREAMSKIATGTNMSSSYSNGTLTLSATDTTYSDFGGSTHGLVPAASSGDSGKFLKGDGTWTDVPAPSVMTGATAQADGTSGLVPAPEAGEEAKFLKGDGTWSQTPQRSDSSIVDLIYPVGSIYMSVASTSPATLFGGTWQQLEDRFLVGASADNAESPAYPAGTTGGAASQSYTPVGTVGGHTLTTNEIPSHNHTFTGTEVDTGIQSADHTHNYTDYYATTTGGTAISVAQLASHNHPTQGWRSPRDCGSGNIKDCVSHGRITTDPASSGNNSVVTNTGSGNTHNHTGQNTSTTRTSQGISANHSHKVTANGTIGNSGGGEAHSHEFTGTEATIATIPPYLAVYMWKRTA